MGIAVNEAWRDQFLMDVMTTAYESGIAYWAVATGRPLRRGDLRIYTFWIEEQDNTDAPGNRTEYEVNGHTIERGIALCGKRETKINRGLRGRILCGSAEEDAGQIDAEAADVIVQLGLFGEIVYG